jgi:Protein of unknown function (DUF3467)
LQLPLIYANQLAITGSAFDLAVDYGYRGPTGDIAWAARVAMSWEQAIILRNAIDQAVERYERQFGPVRDVKSHVQMNLVERSPSQGGGDDGS